MREHFFSYPTVTELGPNRRAGWAEGGEREPHAQAVGAAVFPATAPYGQTPTAEQGDR